MNVLIIGYSSLVRRRILPALASLPGIEKIHIASRRTLSDDVIPEGKRGRVFQGYASALSSCSPCLAYVSLPNSLHAEWVEKSLLAGFHVIVDKPSVTTLTEADRCSTVADRKNLCLAEANVWLYHPLAQSIKKAIDQEKIPPSAAIMVFSSPRANPPTVHYNLSLGGGIVYDRGSYVITCGRFLFGSYPQDMTCRVQLTRDRLDISSSMLLRYSNGAALLSYLSLDAEYQNSLSVIGPGFRFETHRIFTPPSDYAGTIHASRLNASESIPVPAGDTFALFIQDVLHAIDGRTFARFSQMLLDDAKSMHTMRISAFGG